MKKTRHEDRRLRSHRGERSVRRAGARRRQRARVGLGARERERRRDRARPSDRRERRARAHDPPVRAARAGQADGSRDPLPRRRQRGGPQRGDDADDRTRRCCSRARGRSTATKVFVFAARDRARGAGRDPDPRHAGAAHARADARWCSPASGSVPSAGAASMVLYLLAGAAGLPGLRAGRAAGHRAPRRADGRIPARVSRRGRRRRARRAPLPAHRAAASAPRSLGMAVIHLGGVAQLSLLTGSARDAACCSVRRPSSLADVVKAVVAGAIAPRGLGARRDRSAASSYAPADASRAVAHRALLSSLRADRASRAAPLPSPRPAVVRPAGCSYGFSHRSLAAVAAAQFDHAASRREAAVERRRARRARRRRRGCSRFGLALGALGILLPSLGAHRGALARAVGIEPAPGRGRARSSRSRWPRSCCPQSLAEELLSRGYGFAVLREGVGAVVGGRRRRSVGLRAAAPRGTPARRADRSRSVVLAGVFLGARRRT